MPIYEFICENCGHEFEQLLSFSAKSYPACPTCEADAVKRRMSKPAIHFKGSGWYITDSKKSNGANGAGKAKSNEGSGESTSETKSEPKNETKSENSSDKSTAKVEA